MWLPWSAHKSTTFEHLTLGWWCVHFWFGLRSGFWDPLAFTLSHCHELSSCCCCDPSESLTHRIVTFTHWIALTLSQSILFCAKMQTGVDLRNYLLSPPLSSPYQAVVRSSLSEEDGIASKIKTLFVGGFFDHVIYPIIKLLSEPCENRSLIKREAFWFQSLFGGLDLLKKSKSGVPTVLLILNPTKGVSTWNSEQAGTTFRDMCHGWLHRSPRRRVAIHTKWECCSVMPVLLIQLLISSWLGALIADVTNHK